MEARSAKRRHQVDALYELWDVNTSGYLELDEIQVVLDKWRTDGIENFKEGTVDWHLLLLLVWCLFLDHITNFVKPSLWQRHSISLKVTKDEAKFYMPAPERTLTKPIILILPHRWSLIQSWSLWFETFWDSRDGTKKSQAKSWQAQIVLLVNFLTRIVQW